MVDVNNYLIDLKEKDLSIEKIGGKALNLFKLGESAGVGAKNRVIPLYWLFDFAATWS